MSQIWDRVHLLNVRLSLNANNLDARTVRWSHLKAVGEDAVHVTRVCAVIHDVHVEVFPPVLFGVHRLSSSHLALTLTHQ